ncbi:ISAs1 family transposase [Paraglaciecola sp.]|uniref:ISAs1 family transposase n=1 Tax=Paraglaciecola sp. TaxID=1920173 RepID=UPI0030F3C5B2
MELLTHLKNVKETRSHINQTYPLLEVTFLVITAIACGQKGWSDIQDFGEGNLEWLRQYLPYESGIPTRHNIAKIVRAIVPETLLGALVDWANVRRATEGQPLIAVDGKDIRGVQRSGKAAPLSMVSAFDVEQGLVLYHRPCEGKGKEIQAVMDLLDCLDIRDCIITLDALHCLVDTLNAAKDKGADVVVQVKHNQPLLFQAVDAAFQSYWEKPMAEQESWDTTDKGHGRQDSRFVFQLPSSLEGELKQKWPMIKCFIAVVRARKTGKTTSYETSYHISTTELSLELAARATREHWHTENRQHWILDVVFKEDEQTIYAGKSAVNMACFRRFVLNLLRRDSRKLSMPRKMNKAAWDESYRHDILFTN